MLWFFVWSNYLVFFQGFFFLNLYFTRGSVKNRHWKKLASCCYPSAHSEISPVVFFQLWGFCQWGDLSDPQTSCVLASFMNWRVLLCKDYGSKRKWSIFHMYPFSEIMPLLFLTSRCRGSSHHSGLAGQGHAKFSWSATRSSTRKECVSHLLPAAWSWAHSECSGSELSLNIISYIYCTPQQPPKAETVLQGGSLSPVVRGRGITILVQTWHL